MGKTRAVAAAVVLLVAAFAGLSGGGEARPVLGEPVGGTLRKRFDGLIPDAATAYLVGTGRFDGRRWYVVAWPEAEGHLCTSVVGFDVAPPGSSCTQRSGAIDFVAQGGGPGVYYVFGDVRNDITMAVLRSDDGYEARTPTVAVAGFNRRFFAIVATEHHLSGGAYTELSGVTAQHQRVVMEAKEELQRCTSALPALRGGADGLPHAGQTKVARVESTVKREGDAMAARYGATAVASVRRGGQVWRRTTSGDVVVADAADQMIRLYIPDAAACPPTPQTYDGVPIEFVVGAAPTPVQVYPFLGKESGA